MSAQFIANARMYGVAPGAVIAWRALFAVVAQRSGVALEIIDHAYPAPLSELWARPDLGAVFICGWPYVRGVADVKPVAAPVMLDPRSAGQPVYWTDIVVRTNDPARVLADLRGRRIAFTVEDSQSGFSAVRTWLRTVPEKPLFAAEFGPVFTPRKSIEAVISGDADAGPVDSYAHALLRLHAPDLAAQIRTVAQTEPTACPLLVASASLDETRTAALRATFLALHEDETLRPLLESLALARFAEPLPHADYVKLQEAAASAEAAGIKNLETR